MATTVRAIELMLPGSFGKETLSNDGMQNLALGISGAALIALTNVDHTLTSDNQGEAQHFVQILTGALTANVNVIVPAESRVYVADNRTTGAFTVTFKTASGGGVAVDQGVRTLIYCDGTTVYPVASGTGGGGGSGAPTDATYLVQAPHALLTGERAVTDTPTVTWDFATPGAARAQIPDGAVTYPKVQDVTAKRLLGRYTPTSGDVQEITLGTGLTLDDAGLLTASGAGGQPADATLTALAGLATGVNQVPYFTGTDTASQTTLTPFARTLLDDADQAAMQTTLGVVPGTTVQPLDATLTALAGVTTGADMLPFFTGTDLASSTVLTAFMRSLLDDPDAATARATLGVTGGGGSYTDEQAQDAVGAMLVDTATIAFLYDDATPALAAAVQDASITEAKLVLADVTTHNVSTTQHGLVPKAPGSAAQYLDGTGAWSTPAGGGGGAPIDAEYITSTAHATLSAERVLTDTATVTWDRSTAGQIKANAVGGGGYTDEQAQDAVGSILTNTPAIIFTYNDTTPSISAALGFGGVATDRIADDAVTFAKMQNITDARVLGRSTGSGPGNIGEITVGGGLSLAGGVLTSSAVSTFLGLTDTDDYTGQGGNLVTVNAGATGLDYTPLTPAGRALLDDADAAAQRATLGLGTLATQDASAVAISGGTATLADLDVDGTTLRVDSVNHRVGIGTATPGVLLHVNGVAQVTTQLGVGGPPLAGAHFSVTSSGATTALLTKAGAGGTVFAAIFTNSAATTVGSIATTDTATAYNTSSDVRLKENVATLLGALDVIRALRPVSFRWQADGSKGVGFLAHELMSAVPEAVSGLPDEVNDDGSIKPQQVDQSRLVPWLTAGLQAALAQIDALTARISTLEEALGL